MRTYRANLIQNASGDPAVEVTTNNGFTTSPHFERIGEGVFRITAPGMFNGPTWIQVGNYRSERMDPHAWRLRAIKEDEDYCVLSQDAFVIDETIAGDGFVCSIEITVD